MKCRFKKNDKKHNLNKTPKAFFSKISKIKEKKVRKNSQETRNKNKLTQRMKNTN